MSRLIASRNQAYNYICPACRTRVRAGSLLWLWFDGREWLHPDCWKDRKRKQVEETVAVTVDLENTDIEWEEAGPSA